MEYRSLGRTGWKVSTIGFGAWAIGGGEWGPVKDEESMAALHKAIDMGVNLIDTADVYGEGHSERLIAQVLRERSETVYVATKIGRGTPPHPGDGYSRENLTAFVERCLKNLNMETLDLIQLHTPPSEVFDRPEVFGVLDELCQSGKIRFYGASVEKVSEALKVIEYPNLQVVQIIFNMFRHKPAEEFFRPAKEKQVGILARVPLASGLLTGKMSPETTFGPQDHRTLIYGGETFSGVKFEVGLKAAEALKAILPEGMTLAQMALRWILMHDVVTCAIPGAKRPSQVLQNTVAADLPPLGQDTMTAIRSIYDRYIRQHVHHLY